MPKRLNVKPEWTRNGPIRLKINEPLPRLYKGYVNAGMGNFLSPLLQVSYSDVRSRTKSWGVHFLHESTDGGFAGDSIEQGFSSNQLNGWYRKFWKGEAAMWICMNDRVPHSVCGVHTSLILSCGCGWEGAAAVWSVRNTNAEASHNG